MGHGDGVARRGRGGWAWRWAVPFDVRAAIGMTEVQRSLGCTTRREAVVLALPLRAVAQALVQEIRSGASVDRLRRAELLRMLAGARAKIAESEARDAQAEAEAQRERADELRRQLHALHSQHVEVVRQLVSSEAPAAGTRALRVRGPKLSELFQRFAAEKAAGRRWNAKTRGVWDSTLKLLHEALGDPVAASITRAQLVEFSARLQKMPPNAAKRSELAGLTFNELTDGSRGTPIAVRTLNAHLGRASELLRWAQRTGEVPTNVAEGLDVKAAGDGDGGKNRRAYSSAELALLFASEDWKRREFEYPWRYWVSLMAILTGMRLNEICQLSLEHFEEVNGVAVIKVGELQAKNENAIRTVPIHRELIELGLLDYVAKLRVEGKNRLFEELSAGRDGYGQPVSRWFGRFKKKCGIETGELDFHSFRHMFISARMNAGNQQALVNAVTGHQIAGETKTYWTHRDAKALREVVNSVGLPEEVKGLIPRFDEVRIVSGLERRRQKKA